MSTASPTAFAGVVPCAGSSRRMGRSKALLELDGATFLARVVRALARGGCAPVMVVGPAGDARVGEEARRVGAEALPNPDPGDGPITSLRLAIGALSGLVDGLAYLPVDHPLVKPGTVARLLAEARTSGAPIVLPVHDGKRGHPAVFGADVFAELMDPALEGGARTVVHRRLAEARLVEVDDAGVLADIDTPDAYAELVGEPSTPRGEEEPG